MTAPAAPTAVPLLPLAPLAPLAPTATTKNVKRGKMVIGWGAGARGMGRVIKEMENQMNGRKIKNMLKPQMDTDGLGARCAPEIGAGVR